MNTKPFSIHSKQSQLYLAGLFLPFFSDFFGHDHFKTAAQLPTRNIYYFLCLDNLSFVNYSLLFSLVSLLISTSQLVRTHSIHGTQGTLGALSLATLGPEFGSF